MRESGIIKEPVTNCLRTSWEPPVHCAPDLFRRCLTCCREAEAPTRKQGNVDRKQYFVWPGNVRLFNFKFNFKRWLEMEVEVEPAMSNVDEIISVYRSNETATVRFFCCSQGVNVIQRFFSSRSTETFLSQFQAVHNRFLKLSGSSAVGAIWPKSKFDSYLMSICCWSNYNNINKVNISFL